MDYTTLDIFNIIAIKSLVGYAINILNTLTIV